jgi:hypothetical protein
MLFDKTSLIRLKELVVSRSLILYQRFDLLLKRVNSVNISLLLDLLVYQITFGSWVCILSFGLKFRHAHEILRVILIFVHELSHVLVCFNCLPRDKNCFFPIRLHHFLKHFRKWPLKVRRFRVKTPAGKGFNLDCDFTSTIKLRMLTASKQCTFPKNLALDDRCYFCLCYKQLPHDVWPLKTNVDAAGTFS